MTQPSQHPCKRGDTFVLGMEKVSHTTAMGLAQGSGASLGCGQEGSPALLMARLVHWPQDQGLCVAPCHPVVPALKTWKKGLSFLHRTILLVVSWPTAEWRNPLSSRGFRPNCSLLQTLSVTDLLNSSPKRAAGGEREYLQMCSVTAGPRTRRSTSRWQKGVFLSFVHPARFKHDKDPALGRCFMLEGLESVLDPFPSGSSPLPLTEALYKCRPRFCKQTLRGATEGSAASAARRGDGRSLPLPLGSRYDYSLFIQLEKLRHEGTAAHPNPMGICKGKGRGPIASDPKCCSKAQSFLSSLFSFEVIF